MKKLKYTELLISLPITFFYLKIYKYLDSIISSGRLDIQKGYCSLSFISKSESIDISSQNT